jgi:hypothetical protein
MNTKPLIELFFQPDRFFSRSNIYNMGNLHGLSAWVVGMSATMDRIDRNMMQAMVHETPSKSIQFISQSWLHYWGVVMAIGIISALILWWVGGWWYGKRLTWSGALPFDPDRASKTYVYQSLVKDIPMLCIGLYSTLRFSDYPTSRKTDSLWSIALLVCATLLSCWVSFNAATTAFDVSKKKAVFWFLALPITVYVLAWGVLIKQILV